MSEGDVALACASLLVDELARAGCAGVCVAPGSRSAPLALAFSRHGGIPLSVHLDERSAAYYALGLAKASGRPVALVCTSGTAAANFMPAVVEASQACVPLIVLTADRPGELRDTGANQAIDQVKLYGGFVRMFAEAGVPQEFDGAARYWRSLGARAAAAAAGPPAGPVHINCAFREPLVPAGETVDLGPDSEGRANGAPWERVGVALGLAGDEGAALAALAARTDRGVILAGGLAASAPSVAKLAGILGWPLIADPMSGLRKPASTLSAPWALCADEGFAAVHRPDVVVQFGEAPVARATQALAAGARELVVVDPDGRHLDPARHASLTLRSDPESLASLLCRVIEPRGESEWDGSWTRADLIARIAIDDLLDSWEEPFEGRVARDLSGALPDGATLVVSSSMPVRDLDAYMEPRTGLRVLANRGASGIDGFVSTVLGVEAAGAPTYALCGDLSLLHDASGLVWGARRSRAVFVVINNGGGGIFDLLPQSDLPEHEALFVAPHEISLASLAEAAGMEHVLAASPHELLSALDPPLRRARLVEVPVDRALAVARRRAVREAVAAALAAQA
ncbi:MAG: 2-succinyl-5-enolpyruvyl-6-hydroxy-3-cyclohexene-1-carboxylic-acid synthase [Actinomycetota bacterium]